MQKCGLFSNIKAEIWIIGRQDIGRSLKEQIRGGFRIGQGRGRSGDLPN
jgi:hypothetical protein